MAEVSCTDCLDLCAEVALGSAEAEDRAAVLAHVEHCQSCRTALRSMTEVADGLAALVPPAPPPAGFEAKVLGAIGRTPVDRPVAGRLRSRRLVAVAAVALAVALAVGGWAVGVTTSTSSPVVTAPLRSDGTTVGKVVVVPGEHPWISMTVHVHSAIEVVRCEVWDEDGAVMTIGTFTIRDGWGYWASRLPYKLVVLGAKLVLPDGRVLAAATVGAD